MSKTTYRNPWFAPGKDCGPEFYTTDARPVEYRGFQIFERIKGASWELVKDGVCLTQRAGRNGPKRLADALLGDADADWQVDADRARKIADKFGVSLVCEAA